MELFTGGIPNNWNTTTPTLVSRVTAQGRVHSGNSAVNLENSAVLSQTVATVNEGCFYQFSFFAHGEGSQVGVIATVTFKTPMADVPGAIISVSQQNLTDSDRSFGYYRTTTIAAPANVTDAVITFMVSANGEQSMDLDDVSFSVS